MKHWEGSLARSLHARLLDEAGPGKECYRGCLNAQPKRAEAARHDAPALSGAGEEVVLPHGEVPFRPHDQNALHQTRGDGMGWEGGGYGASPWEHRWVWGGRRWCVIRRAA